MSISQRSVRVGITLGSVLIFLIFIVTAYGAGFSHEPARPNGAPSNASRRQSAGSVSENTAPTVAKVISFKVTAGKGGALLEWRTGFEVDNLGFNLYREHKGQRTLINPSIIAGSALIAGNSTPLMAGHSYVWRDAEGTADALYYLESIELSGATSVTGPVAPVAGNALTKQLQATLLADLGASVTPSVQREGPSTIMLAPAAQTPSDASLQNQWAIAARPAVKILVRQNGWYHVGQPELVAAGLDPSVDTNNLQLFADGTEQAMLVRTSGGALGAGDYLEFYGTGLDETETDTHVYWLVAGNAPGKRIRLIGNERPDAIKVGDEEKGLLQTKQPPVAARNPFSNSGNNNAAPGGFVWTAMQIIMPPAGSEAQPTAARTSERQESGRELNTPEPEIINGGRPILPAPTVGLNAETRPQAEAQEQTGGEAASETLKPAEASKATEAPASSASPANSSPAASSSATHAPASSTSASSSSSTRREEAQAQGQQRKARAGRARSRRSRSGGRRTTVARRELSHYSAQTVSGSPGEAQSFSYTIEVKDRINYFSSLLNGDTENFFGKVLASIPVTQALNVSHLDTNAPDSMMLEVALQGVSPQEHNVRIILNDVEVAAPRFFFRDRSVTTIPLNLNLIHEGSNTLKLATTASGDVNLIDYIRLTYPHTYQADNNALRFSLKYSQTARVEGFTTPDIRLLDITDPADVQQLRPMIEPSGAGYALVIGTPGRTAKGRRTLVAFPNGQTSAPDKLVANQPSTLNHTDQSADLVIISHETLKQSIAPLADLRRSQGLAVSVFDVEDVFDEFSYGKHTSRAIKDFLAYTKSNWAKAPRFVLLVGDASYDPKNYFHKGNFDMVPTKLVDTLFTETSSDDWLADLDGDFVPDMALGRLPARTPAELDRMVSKIVNYNPAAASKSALFVADAQGTYPFSFEQENREIAAILPPDISVQYVDRASNPDINVVRAQLFNAINQGPMIINYAGHGTVDAWTGASLFTDADAMALNNGAANSNHLPLVVMMTCLTGYFNDPALDALSESLMKSPNGGAVAAWASSGLTVPSGQSLMNQSLYQSIFSNPSPTLGEAIQKAKAATPDTDVRLTWTLFGDPTMKIR